jgi:hypothetical protein
VVSLSTEARLDGSLALPLMPDTRRDCRTDFEASARQGCGVFRGGGEACL